MKSPQAAAAYRVPSSAADQLYEKDRPPDEVRPAVGTVVAIDDTERTVDVVDAEETITVVALGAFPDIGDEIDYYVVDGLAYTPEPSVGLTVYVQPDPPAGPVKGTLWFDTDEPVPGGGG